eukprot:scpid58084/ scgid28599/ 
MYIQQGSNSTSGKKKNNEQHSAPARFSSGRGALAPIGDHVQKSTKNIISRLFRCVQPTRNEHFFVYFAHAHHPPLHTQRNAGCAGILHKKIFLPKKTFCEKLATATASDTGFRNKQANNNQQLHPYGPISN